MRVSGAAVKKCGRMWVGMEERGERGGRGSLDFLLKIIYHAAPIQNLMKLGHWATQLMLCSFFPQEESIAEYIIPFARCKMGLDEN